VPWSALGAPTKTSSKPSPCTSPPLLTLCPINDPASIPLILKPVVPSRSPDKDMSERPPDLPNTTYALPLPTPDPGAPTIMSPYPSPFTSKPPATDVPAKSSLSPDILITRMLFVVPEESPMIGAESPKDPFTPYKTYAAPADESADAKPKIRSEILSPSISPAMPTLDIDPSLLVTTRLSTPSTDVRLSVAFSSDPPNTTYA